MLWDPPRSSGILAQLGHAPQDPRATAKANGEGGARLAAAAGASPRGSRLAAFFRVGFSLKQLALLGAGAGLFVLAMPPHGIGLLGPLILVPLLVVLRGKTPRVAISCGFLFGLSAYIGGLSWFGGLFGVFAFGLWGMLAIFVAVFAGLFALLSRRWGYRVALYLAPALWLAVDFLRCEQWPLAFGWLSLGYSQQRQPLLAVASIVGVYGLTALLAASSAAIVAVLTLRDRKSVFYASSIVAAFGALIALGQLTSPATSSTSSPASSPSSPSQIGGRPAA